MSDHIIDILAQRKAGADRSASGAAIGSSAGLIVMAFVPVQPVVRINQ